MTSVQVFATPTSGRARSSSVNPTAFRLARAGARPGPSVRSRLLCFGSFGIAPPCAEFLNGPRNFSQIGAGGQSGSGQWVSALIVSLVAGIVIPFLSADGTQPLLIHDLRHVFEHPAVPAEVDSQILHGGDPFFDQLGHAADLATPSVLRAGQGRDGGEVRETVGQRRPLILIIENFLAAEAPEQRDRAG